MKENDRNRGKMRGKSLPSPREASIKLAPKNRKFIFVAVVFPDLAFTGKQLVVLEQLSAR